MSSAPPALWIALGGTMALATGVDLFAHRSDVPDTQRGAVLWSLLWVSVAMAFFGVVVAALGLNAGEEYLSAYVLEESLSADNLLVFLLIFEQLAVPPEHHRRVLFWGIIGALGMRGLFIGLGVGAILRWHFVLYGFGALLVYLGIRLLTSSDEGPAEEPPIVRWLEAHLPFSTHNDGHKFMVREGGQWRFTRLAIALVAIELSDVTFAVDSVPSAFAVSRSTFVLYSANVMAVLGLRSLFIVVAKGLTQLRYLRYGLSTVLMLAGVKLLGSHWVRLPPLVSLAVVVGCLVVTVVASLVRRND